MSNVAIQVEGLSKQYKIGVKNRHDTLRDHLMGRLGSLLRGNTRPDPIDNTIWALKDVTFDVKQGEVIGIIGRNGAGKSTLLKILSRITLPTSGRVKIFGRLASLLEVGTGFQPELTGYENIYLNGVILGMKKAEIDRKLDEIIAFAEIEKFMDTPVKRYSSGMYVRLAFAVAAHVDPEILIVDEVLAVGDTAFQKKCLNKMQDVSKEGRTILFVSHTMPTIQALCQRIVWLENGALKRSGDPSIVISSYLFEGVNAGTDVVDLGHHTGRCRSQMHALQKAWITTKGDVVTNTAMMGDSVTVHFQFRCNRKLRNPGFGFGIEDENGKRIFSLNNYMVPTEGNTFLSLNAGMASLCIDNLPLLPGTYFLTLSVVEDQREWVDCVERALAIHVVPGDVYGSGKIPDKTQGVIYVPGQIRVCTGHDTE